MTKIELRNALNSGKCLEDVLTLSWGQECTIFKANKFKKGDDIVYIPDMELNNITYECQDLTAEAIDEIISYCYTGDDFIDCCEGDDELAEELFNYVDWQHPSSALPEINYKEE